MPDSPALGVLSDSRPEGLLGTLLASAAAWRLGMEAQASAALAGAIEELLLGPSQWAAGAAPILVDLLRAQERGDPIGMADRLEFELVPVLERALAARP